MRLFVFVSKCILYNQFSNGVSELILFLRMYVCIYIAILSVCLYDKGILSYICHALDIMFFYLWKCALKTIKCVTDEYYFLPNFIIKLLLWEIFFKKKLFFFVSKTKQ